MLIAFLPALGFSIGLHLARMITEKLNTKILEGKKQLRNNKSITFTPTPVYADCGKADTSIITNSEEIVDAPEIEKEKQSGTTTGSQQSEDLLSEELLNANSKDEKTSSDNTNESFFGGGQLTDSEYEDLLEDDLDDIFYYYD